MLGTAQALSAATNTVLDLNGNYTYNAPNNKLLYNIRNNLYQFSAAKTLAQIREMQELLIDEDGTIKPFAKYKAQVATLHQQYNENWLAAEYDTALGSAQMARQWQDYQANADVLPMLTYRTAGDKRVRKEHDALDGITLPINDPFWDSYYPPNGWRCRCDVEQSDAEATAPVVMNIQPAFKRNTGKTGIVFTNEHPFMASAGNVFELDAESIYNMQPLSKLYADVRKMPNTPAITNSTTAWEQLRAAHALADTDLVQLPAQAGHRIALKPETFANAQHADQVQAVLSQPNEVWKQAESTWHLRYYQNKILALQYADDLQSLQWLEIAPAGADISDIRKGILMHR